jgi:hypothetical protein
MEEGAETLLGSSLVIKHPFLIRQVHVPEIFMKAAHDKTIGVSNNSMAQYILHFAVIEKMEVRARSAV